MSEKRVRVIGYDWRVRLLGRADAEHPLADLMVLAVRKGVRSRGFCSESSWLRKCSEDLGADLLKNLRVMLGNAESDAVAITPTESFHVEPVIQSKKVGYHALLEVPLARALVGGDKLIAACSSGEF